MQYDIELRGLVTTDSARRPSVITDSDWDSDSDSNSMWGMGGVDGGLSKNSVETMSSSTLIAGVIGNSE